MTIATLPVQSTHSTKTRKPYTKRTPKNIQPDQPTFVKKIIKEELLGWDDKFTTTYFQEKIETVDGEIKDFYVTVPDVGVKVYNEEKPKIEMPLKTIKVEKAAKPTKVPKKLKP